MLVCVFVFSDWARAGDILLWSSGRGCHKANRRVIVRSVFSLSLSLSASAASPTGQATANPFNPQPQHSSPLCSTPPPPRPPPPSWDLCFTPSLHLLSCRIYAPAAYTPQINWLRDAKKPPIYGFSGTHPSYSRQFPLLVPLTLVSI